MGKEKVNKDGGREAVKLRMEVVRRVRKNKETTGVPIAVFFEQAATEKLERKSIFDCFKGVPAPTPEEIDAYAKALKAKGK
jgi:hypothetical protein